MSTRAVESYVELRSEGRTQIVGPDTYREKSVPERKVQIPDRKEPSGNPHESYRAVLFDFYFVLFHTDILYHGNS